jgi:hypothetical protein
MKLLLQTAGLILVAATGCSSPSDVATFDGNGRIIGAIHFYSDPVVVDLPSSVTVNQEFSVSVITYGGGCTSKGETEVQLAHMSAAITPYDYEAFVPCITPLLTHRHEAKLAFTEPGTAYIIVRGRRDPSREVIMIRRSVEVTQ